MKLCELLPAAGGVLLQGDPRAEVRALCCDSRAVRAGSNGTPFKSAFARITSVALQKELCALSAAETAFGISVCCHFFLSLNYTLRRFGGLQPL